MESGVHRRVLSLAALATLVVGGTATGLMGTVASAATDPAPYVVCSPGGTVTITPAQAGAPGEVDCTITQGIPANPGQANRATCIEQSSSPDMVEMCAITQANVSGSNSAIVGQSITQGGDATEYAKQRASVIQTNQFGANVAGVGQSVWQQSNSPGAQSQVSDQGLRPSSGNDPGVTIKQQNTAGRNSILMGQLANEIQSTSDATVQQFQNSTVSASIDQNPAGGGGASTSGLGQAVRQVQQGPTLANQTQIADPHCCNTFNGTKVAVHLNQNVQQFQGNGSQTNPTPGQQSATNEAHCHVNPPTAGNCYVDQFIDQNGTTESATCTGPNCDQGQQCNNQQCAPCPPNDTTDSYCPPPFGVVPDILARPSGALGATSGIQVGARSVAIWRVVAHQRQT